MEEDERNEWGPKGQPSASEQLKISGYTEENKEEYVPKAIRAEQEKRQKAWDNPYFVEAYETAEKNLSALTQNQKNLLDHYGYDFYKSGKTDATGINAALTLGPFAAKIPALAALAKTYPGKAFTTVMQGVGAHDIVNKPEDLAFETLGQKMDTIGNLTTLKPRGMLVTGKELAKKIDHWLGKDFDLFNPKGLFNRKQPITPEGVRIDANNIDLNPNIMQSKGGGGQLEIPGLSGYGQIEIPGLGTAYGRKTRFWFPWELNKKITRPRAKYGDIINIEPRYWKKKKNNVIRKNVTFQKVEELDLSNGFIPTKNHPTFNDYILDLIEADKIPARNINPGDLQLRAKAKGTDLELYQDYLAGYFNTYDTLEGATKVTLGKTPKGNVKYFFPANDIPKVDRVMKIYKLAPEAFHSKYAKGGNINPQAFLADMAQSSTLDDFLAKNFKWQGHHKYIINDAFTLIKGLPMHEVKKMRKLMKDSGIKLGNDPKNITFVPQIYHQGFIHNFLWGVGDKAGYKPRWAGNGAEAKQLQAIIARIPTAEGRIKYVNEFAESMETINDMFDLMVDNFKATKGQHWVNKKPSVEDWQQFMDEITNMDYDAMPQIGMPHEGGIDQFGEQTFKTPFQLEDEIYGSGFSPEDFE